MHDEDELAGRRGGDCTLADWVDDPEILALFTQDASRLQRAVRTLVERAAEDEGLERRLIEALDLAVEESCDDTDASAWIGIVLGEIGSRTAIPALLRGFACDVDETLQDSSRLALLRIGRPALLALMEWIDEEPGAPLRSESYRVLGESGVVEDEQYLAEARDFLRERVARERGRPPLESALEAAIEASARLGDRAVRALVREILETDFRGRNPVLEDALELLEENDAGRPFVPTVMPWEATYGWLFAGDATGDHARRETRLRGGPEGSPSLALRVDADEAGESGREVELSGIDPENALSCFLWGVASTAESAGEPGDLDARRFVADPRAAEPEDGEED